MNKNKQTKIETCAQIDIQQVSVGSQEKTYLNSKNRIVSKKYIKPECNTNNTKSRLFLRLLTRASYIHFSTLVYVNMYLIEIVIPRFEMLSIGIPKNSHS